MFWALISQVLILKAENIVEGGREMHIDAFIMDTSVLMIPLIFFPHRGTVSYMLHY